MLNDTDAADQQKPSLHPTPVASRLIYSLENLLSSQFLYFPFAATLSNLLTCRQVDMRLFRAQRNMYVSGFALLLVPVLSQVISLLRNHGELLESRGSGDAAPATGLQQELTQLQAELNREKKDSAAVKSQCESVKREYDRLMKEHEDLQSRVDSGRNKND